MNVSTYEHTRITIDQWQALIAVVEAGGYAQAAEALHRTQSTVSYAVQKVEALLDLKLFEIQGRKAILTEAGQVIYRRAKLLLGDAQKLERGAKDLAAGWEPELKIAVEVLFPTWLLLDALGKFAAERSGMRIEIYESVLGGTTEALTEGKVQLAIGPIVPPGFFGEPLTQVRMIAAAAPDHPLHRLNRPLTRDDLRQYRHLVIRDSGHERAETVSGWVNDDRWTVSNKATSIRAVVNGLGYAWYAEDTVRDEVAAGMLKPLNMVDGSERVNQLHLMFADPEGAGPGIRRLAALIRESVRGIRT